MRGKVIIVMILRKGVFGVMGILNLVVSRIVCGKLGRFF